MQAPTRRGFGSVVVERTIPFELRGQVHIDYRLEGVHADLRIPAEFVSLGKEPASVAAETLSGSVKLGGRRLLLVEDSMMIALDAQEMLEALGASVEVVANVADGLRAVDRAVPVLAVLDVNLSGETSFPIADALTQAGVPFVFATGYGESVAIPSRFAGVPVATKPYSEEAIAAVLAQVAPRAD